MASQTTLSRGPGGAGRKGQAGECGLSSLSPLDGDQPAAYPAASRPVIEIVGLRKRIVQIRDGVVTSDAAVQAQRRASRAGAVTGEARER